MIFCLAPVFCYTLFALTTIPNRQTSFSRFRNRSPQGWVFLLFICFIAAVLRFWQLDQLPAGLYRDEAFNGLDALNVLDGAHALFFTANNGREPAYIYLTALQIALWGQTTWAVRLTAALTGTLTTFVVYLLGKSWWREEIGLYAAWLWAVSVWPIHLSRIGLRPILLAPLFPLTLWLATEAYRRQKTSLWFLTGLLYGLTFYTYLASRLTPALILVALAWLWWQTRTRNERIPFPWQGVGIAALGLLIMLLPWGLLAFNQPDILFGRTGQVSIFHPDINGGNLWGALWQSSWRSLGLFFWQGDTIIRHNPAGRPLFDRVMIIPFLLGLAWCGRHWRKFPSLVLIAWIGVMLIGTILAEDPPHFLRASGVLPAALFLPALGLGEIGRWLKPNKTAKTIFISLLLLASLGFTWQDYFVTYAQDDNTGYLFEEGISLLAADINQQPDTTTVILEKRFLEGWPSTGFLLQEPEQLHIVSADQIGQHNTPPDYPLVLYVWPHDPAVWSQVETLLGQQSPQQLAAELGAFGRGDLESAPYPLYLRYSLQSSRLETPQVSYLSATGDSHHLHHAQAFFKSDQNQLDVQLTWAFAETDQQPIITFVHVLDPTTGTLIGQEDSPPAQGYIPQAWWSQLDSLQETKQITLSRPLTETDLVFVGIYPANNAGQRYVLVNNSTETVWAIPPANMNMD